MRDTFRLVKNANSDYMISREGKVFNRRKKTFCKAYKDHRGYYYVNMRIGNKSVKKFIHIMLAECYLNKPSDLFKYVRHKDGRKWNNNVDNIYYTTKKAI